MGVRPVGIIDKPTYKPQNFVNATQTKKTWQNQQTHEKNQPQTIAKKTKPPCINHHSLGKLPI